MSLKLRWSNKVAAIISIGIFAFLALATIAEPALAAKQSITASAYFQAYEQDGCVRAGKPARVTFRITNLSHEKQKLVLWFYSATTYDSSGNMYGKGPTVPVSAKKSGLVKTTSNPIWRWNDITVQPGAMVERTVYIPRVPPKYIDQNGEEMDAPFWLYGHLNLHHSGWSDEVGAHTRYCKGSA